ncbi:nucleotide exchange factor GrpE [Candidatus Tremblaya phenacola]|uniref:nucleotide exchange factor GrpE n=1 Tax=Candidatus Tremblayella phenacoccinincola TaxID=1010676 RepID=UPI00132F5E74|nr:nucleotide exchange factor GrpE [Candidatus Tremblaya phenacola]KAH0998209.1 hypothetical protein FKM95_000108 [Candidatus Tremblaya phenacola]
MKSKPYNSEAIDKRAVSDTTKKMLPQATPEFIINKANNEELKKLYERSIDLEERLLRTRSELENIRRKAHEDLEKSKKLSVEKFAEGVFPFLDSLELVLSDSSSIRQLKEGIGLIIRQFRLVLERNKVSTLNPLHQMFNPRFHQAVAILETNEPDNIVVSVLQKGHLIHGRLFRPALVIVSRKCVILNQHDSWRLND